MNPKRPDRSGGSPIPWRDPGNVRISGDSRAANIGGIASRSPRVHLHHFLKLLKKVRVQGAAALTLILIADDYPLMTEMLKAKLCLQD